MHVLNQALTMADSYWFALPPSSGQLARDFAVILVISLIWSKNLREALQQGTEIVMVDVLRAAITPFFKWRAMPRAILSPSEEIARSMIPLLFLECAYRWNQQKKQLSFKDICQLSAIVACFTLFVAIDPQRCEIDHIGFL